MLDRDEGIKTGNQMTSKEIVAVLRVKNMIWRLCQGNTEEGPGSCNIVKGEMTQFQELWTHG